MPAEHLTAPGRGRERLRRRGDRASATPGPASSRHLRSRDAGRGLPAAAGRCPMPDRAYVALGDSFTAGTGCLPGESLVGTCSPRSSAAATAAARRSTANLAVDGARPARTSSTQLGQALQLRARPRDRDLRRQRRPALDPAGPRPATRGRLEARSSSGSHEAAAADAASSPLPRPTAAGTSSALGPRTTRPGAGRHASPSTTRSQARRPLNTGAVPGRGPGHPGLTRSRQLRRRRPASVVRSGIARAARGFARTASRGPGFAIEDGG